MAQVERLTNTAVKALEPREKYFDVHDGELPGFLVRVQPTGVKTFYLRYTLPDGTRRTFRIADAATATVDVARKAARDHWADATRGDDPMERKQRPREHTLGSFLDDIYAKRATHKTAVETMERCKRCFDALMKRPLGDIRPMWVENWRKSRMDDGKAQSTINRDLDALRGVLTKAVDWGYLPEHPLKRVKKFKLDGGTKPRYLTEEEEQRLVDALVKREADARARRVRYNKWLREHGRPQVADLDKVPYTDHLMPMTLVALNTGMRRGELFNLQWEDVTLSGTPQIVIHGKTAKGGRTRHIPLNRTATDVLTKWKSQSTGTGLVFPSPKGGGRMDHIRKSWAALVKDAELTNFRFHDCRHHFASRLVQNGVDLNTVRELLGHSDLKLTLRYAHLAPHNAAAAVSILDAPRNVVKMPKRKGAKS